MKNCSEQLWKICTFKIKVASYLKNSFSQAVLFFALTLGVANLDAQESMASVGFQMEFAQDSDLLEAPYRITPWVSFILPRGFFVKLTSTYSESQYKSDEAKETVSIRSLGSEVGYTLPLLSLPYIYVSGLRVVSLKNDRSGDRSWWEYGLGVGNKMRVGAGASLYGNIEYRVFEKHQINSNTKDQWIQGEGLLAAFGLQWAVF